MAGNRYADFLLLHGDDEPDGTATGFHKIQGNGTRTRLLGDNLIDTVGDGIFHIGFRIVNDRFLSEDGNQNATLSDVSTRLNYFVNNRPISYGDWTDDVIIGNGESEQLLAYGGDDLIDTRGGSDLLDGSWGNDTLLAGAGADVMTGGSGRDLFLFGQTGHIGLAAAPHDTITDFVSGDDLIDLSAWQGRPSVAWPESFA